MEEYKYPQLKTLSVMELIVLASEVKNSNNGKCFKEDEDFLDAITDELKTRKPKQ